MRTVRIGIQDFLSYIFIFLYPILPSYFKVAGYESGTVLAILYVILYFFTMIITRKSLKIDSNITVFIISGMIFSFESILHGEISRFIVHFVQKTLVILCLYDYFTKKESRVLKIENILISAGIFLGAFGVIEFITRHSAFWFLYNGSAFDMTPDLQTRGSFVRVETTFGHAITYAIFCSFIALLSFYLMYKYKNKTLYKVAYFLMLINLFLTVSRAPILIFIACNALLAILLGKKVLKKYIKAVISFFAVLLLLCLLFPNTIGEGFGEIINIVLAIISKTAETKVSGLEATGNPFTYRLGLFSLIPQILQNNVWIGIGAGNANINTFYVNGYLANSIDNSYVNTLLRYGVIGVVTLYVPFIILLVQTLKNYIKSRDGLFACYAVLILMYLLNILSVAQMSEEKTFYILIPILLAYRAFYPSAAKHAKRETNRLC